jgi:hypothetical protein
MRCTNCDSSVPGDLGACPQCGVFVRVVAPPKARSGTRLWVLALLLIAAAIGAATYFLTRTPPAAPPRLPVRVVKGRPGGARSGAGATISEPEAILRLQRSFAASPDCIAIMSKGYEKGAYNLTAVNRCEGTRLGRWRVDGRTGAVARRSVGE